ncbi:MAG: hypothetical protein L0099_03815 [Acidobacteria bacterium]|nr:hypothetical protein [Acidobacteriota bacterium]
MTTTPNSPGGNAGSRPPFPWLGWGWLHLAALAGFLALYFLVERDPSFAPISVLALLACVLARLDEEKRRVAAVPITLAALMLAGRVGVHGAYTATRWRAQSSDLPEPGVGWLPLFFAACIFLAPELRNYTGRLMMSLSVLVLAAGLLPGDTYKAVFITCQYFLFLAIVAGLGLDFTSKRVASSAPLERTS